MTKYYDKIQFDTISYPEIRINVKHEFFTLYVYYILCDNLIFVKFFVMTHTGSVYARS